MCCIHREIVRSYSIQVRELGFRIQELISESLGLEKDHIKNVLGEQGQHMAVNFYPPCPEPELTYGLPAHTDPNALTILLQDLSVAGLQVLLKDGKWVAVNPHPDAFVINIGDQLQVNLHFLLPRGMQNECRWAARLNGNEHFHVLV
jgi:isopenicillin N synthase-like dioxygenase